MTKPTLSILGLSMIRLAFETPKARKERCLRVVKRLTCARRRCVLNSRKHLIL